MGEHKLKGIVLCCIEDDSTKRPSAEEIAEWLQNENGKIRHKNAIARRTKPYCPPRLKIIALGASGTGKTCIIKRFVHNCYVEFFEATLGQDLYSKGITLHEKEFCLQIFDTAGQERFHSIPQNLLRDVDGVLLVFDQTKRATFNEGLPKMLQLINNNKSDNTSLILVGNKADAKREVTRAQAEDYARRLGVHYIETSAKTGQSIEELFEEIAREIYDTLDLSDIETYVPSARESSIRLTEIIPRERNICEKLRDWFCR